MSDLIEKYKDLCLSDLQMSVLILQLPRPPSKYRSMEALEKDLYSIVERTYEPDGTLKE